MEIITKVLEAIQKLLDRLKEGKAADIIEIIKNAFESIGSKE